MIFYYKADFYLQMDKINHYEVRLYQFRQVTYQTTVLIPSEQE
jgi:hypothetical protein